MASDNGWRGKDKLRWDEVRWDGMRRRRKRRLLGLLGGLQFWGASYLWGGVGDSWPFPWFNIWPGQLCKTAWSNHSWGELVGWDPGMQRETLAWTHRANYHIFRMIIKYTTKTHFFQNTHCSRSRPQKPGSKMQKCCPPPPPVDETKNLQATSGNRAARHPSESHAPGCAEDCMGVVATSPCIISKPYKHRRFSQEKPVYTRAPKCNKSPPHNTTMHAVPLLRILGNEGLRAWASTIVVFL